MKKLLKLAPAVVLTLAVSACGPSNGIANSGIHIATSLDQKAQITINGTWAVNAASLLCDQSPKSTSTSSVYTFNSSTNSGAYVTDIPATRYFPARKQTVNFAIKAMDSMSFSIQTTGDLQCVFASGQSCTFASQAASLPITAANPVTINFQYSLGPSGTIMNLRVNDGTDRLTCGISESQYISSFLVTRQ